MIYSEIHSRLNTLSTANSPNELINLVLNRPREDPSLSNHMTKRASEAVNDLFSRFSQEINWIDRPALTKIHTIICADNLVDYTGNLYEKKCKKHLKRIENAVFKAIQLTHQPAESSFPETLSLDPYKSLIHDYLSLEECMNLVVAGDPPPDKKIEEIIKNSCSNKYDVLTFVYELEKWRKANKDVFNLMLATFLKNAPIEIQHNLFFKYPIIPEWDQRAFIDDIWKIISRNETYFYLTPFNSRLDLDKITSILVDRDRKVKELDLNLTNYRLRSVFPNRNEWPTISSLKTLSLRHFRYDDIEFLKNSSGLENLKELRLARYSNIFSVDTFAKKPDVYKEIIELICVLKIKTLQIKFLEFKDLLTALSGNTNNNLDSLEELILSNIYLCNVSASLIVNANNLKLKVLNLSYNRFITDEVIDALIARINDKTKECPYRNTLQYVHLDETGVTVKTKEKLNLILKKNREKFHEQETNEYKVD